ncbi:hypothetical protein PR048_014580 [Dryococelus australis]|uniref:Uncharacterized protein n=1 Tax=Dryococelus australis TaxID=614101 RepID=A0ABQ9HEM4_9NEOP|nr:hypothetical protein PR048_014580 [Dryococelus australis]
MEELYKAPLYLNGSRLCLQLLKWLMHLKRCPEYTLLQPINMWSSESHIRQEIRTMQDWLKLHNPFETGSPSLVCVINGLIASSAVDCDTAKDAVISAMKSMIGKPFSGITLKRKDVVREHFVEVKSTQLFHRMLCVVRSDEDLAENLSCELSA